MRKLIFLILFLNLSLLSASEVKIKVAYDPDYAPFSYDLENKPYGLLIDIWKLWAEKNNYKVEFIDGKTWDGALGLVESKQVDFFLGTDPYEKWMESSIPFYKTKTAIFKLKQKELDISSIGIIGNDYEEQLKQEYPNTKLVSYETYKELVDALVEKKIDSIYDDSIAINDYIFQKRLNHIIKQTDKFSVISDICAISAEQSKVELFNKGFHKLDQNSLEKIEKNWVLNDEYRYFNKVHTLLSEDEKRWMERNPITRVAVMDYWPKNENGNSLHTEVLKLINKYIGTNIIPIVYSTWKEGFLEASKSDGLHGIMGLSYSKEREQKYFYYSPAYNFTPSYLITRKDDNSINILQDIENKTIYLKDKSIIHKMIESKYPNTKVIDLPTVDDMYESLSTKNEADAIISYFASKDKIAAYNLKITELIYDRYGEVSIGINHKYPQLNSIIAKAFKLIPKTELAKIRDKKYQSKTRIKLSKAEKDWINKNKVIKFAVDPNWLPIESIGEKSKKYEGMMSDYLNKIKEISGLKFELVSTNKWRESLNLAKTAKVDMLAATSKTPSKEEFLDFSNTTIELTDGIIMKGTSKQITKLKDLEGLKVGVPEGTSLHYKLQKDYPRLDLVPIKGTSNGIENVLDGNVDAYVGNLEVISHLIFKKNLLNIKVVYKFKEHRELHIALIKGYSKEALSIINKSIASISREEKDIIRKKWIGLTVVDKTDWKLIAQVVGAIILVLLFVIFNNRKLKSMVDDKTAEISQLLTSFDKHVIASKTDPNGKIIYISEAFSEISGYTKEELIGKSHRIVNHEDMGKEIFSDLWKTIKSGNTWKGEIKNKTKDGGFYWVEAIISPDYDKKGDLIGYSAIRQDITPKKEVEELTANLEIKVEERTSELALEKENIEQILTNILLPVLITSKEKRTVVYANQFAQELYELEYHQMINKPIDEIYTLKDGPNRIIEKLKNYGKVDSLEERVITSTGKEFTALLSVTPILYNNEECYIGMTVDITEQKEMEHEIRAVHKHTKESIEYASLIQCALIPEREQFLNYFNDSFVIWYPKDTVGGDIYLFEKLRHDDECLLLYIDCTGHGVPGAFVTMLVKAIERQIIAEIINDETMDVSPAWVMAYFNRTMKHLLKQDNPDSLSNAGWDGGIIYYNKKEKVLKFAGAETPLFYVDNDGKLNTIKGNRYSVGYKKCDPNYEYKETVIDVKQGMKFYCTTDGYLDQNGGEKDFPFGKKRFTNIIKEFHQESMAEQQTMFLFEMQEYESCIPNNERNDDMTVIGFEI